MRTLFFVLFSSICLWGCKKNDIDNPPVPFTKANIVDRKYLINQERHTSPQATGGTSYFQYINKRVSKRIGGDLPFPGGAYPTEGIYDTVEYIRPDSVVVIAKDNIDGVTVHPRAQAFSLKNGLIVKKITYSGDLSRPYHDTMYYFYDSWNRLNKTEQYFQYEVTTRDFFFNVRGNLERIATVRKARGQDIIYSTTEEIFGGYDNRYNPLFGQTFWDDLLYRSLSLNNFTTYSYTMGSSFDKRGWRLTYDSFGRADFSK